MEDPKIHEVIAADGIGKPTTVLGVSPLIQPALTFSEPNCSRTPVTVPGLRIVDIPQNPLKMTGGPAGPTGPAGPCAPIAPVEPVVPAGPVAPAGPCDPVAPVAPVAPAGPCDPVAPALATKLQAAGALSGSLLVLLATRLM